ncbi:MAG: ABC transporter ATP-binding protein [Candidatus Micrarchaeota archaeon]
MDDAITGVGLAKRFGRTDALRGVSLSIPKNSVYCIAGENGSGKTTLLNILSGAIVQDGGSVQAHGSIGYCRQTPLLYSDLSIRQNLSLFAEMLSSEPTALSNAASMLNLFESLEKKALEASAGTRKKAELAVSLLNNPEILLMDEPTTGLDSFSSGELLTYIKSQKGKKTVVIATHQLCDLEGIATHLLVLEKGKKIFEGKVQGQLARLYEKITKKK